MSELENQLRTALREAVPPSLEPHGLAEGAQRYAVRARRVRVVAGGCAAVVIALVLGLTFTDFRFLATPAGGSKKPSASSALCTKRLPPPSAPPAKGQQLPGDVEAHLCPASERMSPGGAGWTLPADSLTDERWIARFRSVIAEDDPAHPCTVPDSAVGPAFTVVFRHNTGRLTTYRSVDLSCRGRNAVAAFLGDLALARAKWQAASLGPDDIDCAPLELGDIRVSSLPIAGRILTRTTGVLCLYPLFEPDGVEPLVGRPPYRIVLSPAQMAIINADLEQTTLREGAKRSGATGACRKVGWTLHLRLNTPGAHLPGPDPDVLSSSCTDELMLVNTTLTWVLEPKTAAMIASLVPAN